MWEAIFYSGFAIFWLMLWGVGAILQLGCIVHAIKTGRPYYWIFVIFWFSYLGVIAYLLVEVRPSLGKGKFDLHAMLWKLKSRDERILIRQAIAEHSGTIKNRLLLADELAGAGRHEEECTVLSDGLRGAFKDDAQLLLRVAEAQLDAGKIDAAQTTIHAIEPERSTDFQMKLKLLQARLLGRQGRIAEAETLFQELIAVKRNEAPRYFYAELLLNTNRRDEGVRILADILHQYRRGTPVWRYQERRWYFAAKRMLKCPAALSGAKFQLAKTDAS